MTFSFGLFRRFFGRGNIFSSHRPPSALVVNVPSEVRAGDGPIEIQERFGSRVDQAVIDDRAGIDDQDLIAINSKGDSIPLELVRVDPGERLSTLATYRLTPSDGAWTRDDVVGDYEVRMNPGEVENLGGLAVKSRRLATFSVRANGVAEESSRRLLRSLIGRRTM